GAAESLCLAVRAARGALAEDPTAVSAQLLLGQAYLYLNHRTRERFWDADFRLLGLVRYLQAVTAAELALKLGPNREAAEVAHDTLANLYHERGYLDASLDHLEELLRLVQAGGARPGEGVENFTR